MKKYLPIFLLLFSTAAFGALTKWVDEKGKVHYSDQPPPANVKAEVLRSTPSPAASDGVAVPGNAEKPAAASAPAAPKTVAEREAELKKEQQKKKEAAEKTAREQEAVEAKKANCLANQKNLRALQEGMRMVEINEKGERSYIDDAERQRRIAKAQENINDSCK